jgi:hypothetical protein
LTENVAACQKADELSMPHDGKPFDVLVHHERDNLGERLLRSDAEHLSCHDVAHASAAIGTAWLSLRHPAPEVGRHEQITEKVAVSEQPDETALIIDDWQRAEIRLDHRGGSIA